MPEYIQHNHEDDGIDRRGFLRCMAWAGTGVLWTFAGGVARGQTMHHRGGMPDGNFHFAQISDSHIGFHRPENPDVTATLQAAVDRMNALPSRPDFLIHTGDISHLSKPAEFDTADSILITVKTGAVFYVPGEHDVLGDDGRSYLGRYGANAMGAGWFSFDHKGVHFVGLVNVLDLKAGGMGSLGREQLDWLAKDVAGLSASTPIVVFAHIPLWTVYAEWGWGTGDGLEALGYLKRFGSVTVLNGHIHQTMQKVEGNMMFHTAASTAFPQPRPGSASSPGPMQVPPDQLRGYLGLTRVTYVPGKSMLAVVDSTLDGGNSDPAVSAGRVTIDNFQFAPQSCIVPAGAEVTWINRDDVPHLVAANDKSFASPPLDTGERFTRKFEKSGEYPYYCTLHPRMTGTLRVTEPRL